MTEAESRWAALAAWYRGAGRDLPWRGSPDPWVILVSEVMLQQTQVNRVAERFVPFMTEFPAPHSLAGASRQQALAAWSGLGYNRRAVRLQDAARMIDDTGWPTTSTALRQLPGVGSYTAAAVACFAFGEQVPAVDINVRRVLSRWMGRVLTPRQAEEVAGRLLPPDEASPWLQSIMDLGSGTCTSRDPACSRCPCQPWCSGGSIVVSSRKQSTFRGSVREARGAILKALTAAATLDLTTLAGATGVAEAQLDAAANALAAEGLIHRNDGLVVLRESLDSTTPYR